MKTYFFKNAFTGLILFALLFLKGSYSFAQVMSEGQGKLFKIGILGSNFAHYDLQASLKMIQRMDIHYMCIKDIHLPQNSTTEEIEIFHANLNQAGVKAYSVGLIYMRTKAQVDTAFEYAKRVGVKMIIAAPNHELLSYVEQKVKQYDIRVAIHIHGGDVALYPNAADVMKYINNLDPRIGICLDIGHEMRTGSNAVQALKKYKERIIDIHIKNVTAGDKSGKTCEMDRGIIDIVAFVKMLNKVKYSGVCSIEFEKDPMDPFPGLSESVGYLRGVVDALKTNR